jgi:hypothetical protein
MLEKVGLIKREEWIVTLRCLLDGLLLPAEMRSSEGYLIAYDGEESFALEALEALYYEVVAASREEWLAVEQAQYRLLRQATDFRWIVG